MRDPKLAAAFANAKTLGLPDDQADLLSGDATIAELFEATTAATHLPDVVAKWMINELPRALGDRELADVALDAARFAELIELLGSSAISATVGKTVLAEMIATGKRASELSAAHASSPATDLAPAIDAVIAANPDKAAQYKAGKTGLLGFFVGQVMKATPNADAAAVNRAVRQRLT